MLQSLFAACGLSRRRPFRPFAAALVALAVETTAARGANPLPPTPGVSQLEAGWHLIRPGDTLESLALTYLGSSDRWPEIHRLNPRIDDPHWIYPGRRVRVLVDRPSAEANARVEALSKHVEASPSPVPWLPAQPGDLLLERDGLRTFEQSSARLRFDDGTTATVSEDSLVFIRRQTPARAAKPRKEIEIERGQADLDTGAPKGVSAPEIDVIVGDSRTTGHAEPGGSLRLRQRREGDAARVMLYEGKGSVSAAAGSVDLAAGTGTTVRDGAAPTPPRALLPAPELIEPAEGAEFRLGVAFRFRWKAVPGAERYVVELCEDSSCGKLLERLVGVKETSCRPHAALRGSGYWRVTGVDASGLDGYPSRSRAYRVPLLISTE